ncbi:MULTISPECIES: type II secretion system secretin GspD [unclassified Psychrobacter]|uniref:type II secretion system secretin GspD n=1 Tax=unclassified Psychrobacter TaxID=196806 RepID=UPI0025B3DAB6|nr:MULTISPECIES: type II secretion system secretin GspD [unclassified Psychrobacter]MDN3453155.1 type II secretion system secretin GspD [Psychrobacter sp. APC 3350]MDN3501638.1 type II secretion system secretin GspD [Psychrobacter sp. 5A.1]
MVSFQNFSVTPLYRILQRVMRLCRPLCLVVPLWAASAGLASAESWKVNLQDADIKAFINEVATITDQNFVLDPRINGNVTVISNKALSRDEIYQLFLSVMQVNGIAAIDSGTTIKLVPDNVAKQSGVAVDLRGDSVGESLATRVIYLTNTQAAEVLGVIRPLMPQSAHAAAVPGVNALVLSDRADSLNQLTALIRDLDSNVNDSLQVIPLRHVDAERMMELISALVASAGSGQAQGGNNQLKVIADTSSDRLLVKGSPEMIAKVQEMVNQLDTTPTRRLSGLRVFRLKYASAGHIADMLRGLLANQSINSAGATSTLESASLNDASTTGSAINSAATGSAGSNTAAVSTSSTTGASTGVGGRPFSIIADETQNAVIVNAAPELMFEIEDAVNQLDSRRAQVLIQAAIVEVSGDDATQLGVQWALGNANSGYGVVNFNNVGASATTIAAAALAGTAGVSAAASSIAGALIGIGDSRKDSQGNTEFYGAILQALDSSTSANLLSMPSILTLDNEKASILVGQNVPFVTGSFTTSGNNSNNPFQTIDRQDIGINLNVIPHIGDNGTVRLEVSQEVSSVVPGSTGNASGLITNKSLINTTILADDQQTIALGGLMRDNTTTRQQKVPGLGNVPVIGRLFRSDNDTTQKSNLIIFLQPTILRDGGAVASITERKFNQMRVLQLVIDKNGTIKQLPLSGTEGWNGDVSTDYELMPLNPLIPKRDQAPKSTSQGFTKVDSPNNSLTTYPLNR